MQTGAPAPQGIPLSFQLPVPLPGPSPPAPTVITVGPRPKKAPECKRCERQMRKIKVPPTHANPLPSSPPTTHSPVREREAPDFGSGLEGPKRRGGVRNGRGRGCAVMSCARVCVRVCVHASFRSRVCASVSACFRVRAHVRACLDVSVCWRQRRRIYHTGVSGHLSCIYYGDERC